MLIAALAIYPVKGLRAVPLDRVEVERCGFAGDRRWAIVRPTGQVLTQRELPAMARIDARLDGRMLRLETAGHGGVDARPTDHPVTMTIWGTAVPTLAANPEASEWLSAVLGTPCTLAYMPDPTARPVTPDLAQPGDHVSLADGFPILLTSTGSLDDLNGRLGRTVPMARFRPNLVISGAPAWAEDSWTRIEAGPLGLRLASPCSRCKVITLDQDTGDNPARNEPLKTLGTFHRDERGRITFGWNVIPESTGTLWVGDVLTLRQ